MDGENHGNPYVLMDDLGVHLFSETPIYDIERFEPYSFVRLKFEDLSFLMGPSFLKKVSLCITRFW